MKPVLAGLALERYRRYAQRRLYRFPTPSYKSEQDTIPLLTDQFMKPVLWTACMNKMEALSIHAFIDTRPRETLEPFLKERSPEAKIYAIDSVHSTMLDCLDNLRSDSERSRLRSTSNLMDKCLSIAVCSKNNNSDADEYQENVIEVYKIIERIKEEITASGKEPTLEQTENVLHLLRTILEGKMLLVDELKLV